MADRTKEQVQLVIEKYHKVEHLKRFNPEVYGGIVEQGKYAIIEHNPRQGGVATVDVAGSRELASLTAAAREVAQNLHA